MLVRQWISVSSLNALGFTMEKGAAPSLFVNDGSFMERFKQLQQENEKEKGKGAKLEEPKQRMVVPATSTPNSIPSKTNNVSKTNGTRKTPLAAPNGKLAFSLKQKSKLVPPPVKLGADEDEEETDAGNLSSDAPMKRQKLGQKDSSEHPSPQVDVGNYCLYEYPLSGWVGTEGLCRSFGSLFEPQNWKRDSQFKHPCSLYQ